MQVAICQRSPYIPTVAGELVTEALNALCIANIVRRRPNVEPRADTK